MLLVLLPIKVAVGDAVNDLKRSLFIERPTVETTNDVEPGLHVERGAVRHPVEILLASVYERTLQDQLS
jgi:hypothetical protein